MLSVSVERTSRNKHLPDDNDRRTINNYDNNRQIRNLALSYPETTEEPHFEKTSFRVKKKIFATYDQKNNRVCLKLSEIEQDVFSAFDKALVYPVPNKWGKQGWTFFQLEKVREDFFSDALTIAYCEAAPKNLSQQVRPNDKTTNH